MVVVSDTGPLRYLVEIDAIDLLPNLYGGILTTPEVLGELKFDHFPDRVRTWAETPPTWLEIAAPTTIRRFTPEVHQGEASAISLAVERSADLILIDERTASAVALDAGLETYGLLGVVARGGARELIDFEDAMARIKKTKFRMKETDIERARELYYELCEERRRDHGRSR